jgi:hypothetical protein
MRSPLVGAALLSVILLASPAFAQQGSAAAESHDFVLNGATYRVPRTYQPIAPTSPQAAHRLSFGFWVSDLAPALPTLNTTFWPPEPGRPSESADDFVVLVVTTYGDQRTIEMLQASVRAAAHGKPDREYGLDCLRPRSPAPAQCITDTGHEPAAHFTLLDSMSTVRTFAFSARDGVYTTVTFPLIGLPKWQAVLCGSYALLRRWRVSGGPPPDDCSKLPVLSR